MGDANPPSSSNQSEYHPNRCEHPFEKEEEEVNLVTENGETLSTYTFTVCQRCGYVLEQPDKFDHWHFGPLNGRYDS